MENLENNVVNNEVQENTEVEAKEVKTFTQDELNKIVAERIAKEKKKLFEKQVREFEETKKAFEAERLLNETSKQLASKNLPIEFAEMLKGEDAESTFNNINVFEAKFNEALEKMVTERLRGATPKVATSTNVNITKEQFRNISYMEKMDLYSKDIELFNKLNG